MAILEEAAGWPDPYEAAALAAAERAVIDTGIARYLGAQLVIPKHEFMERCMAFEDACRELLRLRAARKGNEDAV